MSANNNYQGQTPICRKFLSGKCRGACRFRHEIPTIQMASNTSSTASASSTASTKYRSRSDMNTKNSAKPKQYKNNNKVNPEYISTCNKYQGENNENYRKIMTSRKLWCMYCVDKAGNTTDKEFVEMGNSVVKCYENAMELDLGIMLDWYNTVLDCKNPLVFNATTIINNLNTERSILIFTYMLRIANAYMYNNVLSSNRDSKNLVEESEWCQYMFKRFAKGMPNNIHEVDFDRDIKKMYNYCLYKLFAYTAYPILNLEMYQHRMMAMYWVLRTMCMANNIILPTKLDVEYIRGQCASGNYY